MLQRIYGTAWESEEQLKAYLHFKDEAKRRDHRRLGQDLDLFSIQVSGTVVCRVWLTFAQGNADHISPDGYHQNF